MKPFAEFRPGILEETVINKVDVKTILLTEKVMYLAMCCKIIYNNYITCIIPKCSSEV